TELYPPSHTTLFRSDRLTGRYFIDQFQNAANFDPHNYTSYSNGSGTRVQNANIGLTHTFSPTLLNDFHFGYVRQFSKRGPPPGRSEEHTSELQSLAY